MFHIQATKENIPELELILQLFNFEGLPWTIVITPSALVTTKGKKLFVVSYEGKLLFGFYDVVKCIEDNGLKRV